MHIRLPATVLEYIKCHLPFWVAFTALKEELHEMTLKSCKQAGQINGWSTQACCFCLRAIWYVPFFLSWKQSWQLQLSFTTPVLALAVLYCFRCQIDFGGVGPKGPLASAPARPHQVWSPAPHGPALPCLAMGPIRPGYLQAHVQVWLWPVPVHWEAASAWAGATLVFLVLLAGALGQGLAAGPCPDDPWEPLWALGNFNTSAPSF